MSRPKSVNFDIIPRWSLMDCLCCHIVIASCSYGTIFHSSCFFSHPYSSHVAIIIPIQQSKGSSLICCFKIQPDFFSSISAYVLFGPVGRHFPRVMCLVSSHSHLHSSQCRCSFYCVSPSLRLHCSDPFKHCQQHVVLTLGSLTKHPIR